MSNPDSETWSLDSSVMETVDINGRTYQRLALEKGCSYTPIDEDERERLDRMHEVLQHIFDNKLIFPPIPRPTKILDCGFGTAAWACQVAEAYPDCQVFGVDITPHLKPDEIPQNLWLQIDDLNQPFTFQTNEFDLVHSRHVVGGIHKRRWHSYIRDCFRVVKPGGWLQFVEIYYNIQSDNGTITQDHATRQVSDLYAKALGDTKDIRAPMKLEHMMQDAGCVEIGSRMIQIPLNGWNNNPREREIGELFHSVYKDALGSNCNYLFSQFLGMSMAEIHVLVAAARQELENKSLKPYVGLYLAIGRKPNS